MEKLAHVVLFAWIIIIPLLFTRMDRRRAVLIALVAGWLFLPELQMFAVPVKEPVYRLTTQTGTPPDVIGSGGP